MMNAVEFETQFRGKPTLAIPKDVADRLPRKGKAKVIVMFDGDDGEERAWQLAAYEQFAGDDSEGDAVYDKYAT